MKIHADLLKRPATKEVQIIIKLKYLKNLLMIAIIIVLEQSSILLSKIPIFMIADQVLFNIYNLIKDAHLATEMAA